MDDSRVKSVTQMAAGAKSLIELLFLPHVLCSMLLQVMLSDMLFSLSEKGKPQHLQNIAAFDVHRGGHQAGQQCEANAGQANHAGF